MAEWLERRQLRRVALHLPLQQKLRVGADAGAGVGWTRDLSEGGACVELPEFLLPGTALQLRLQTGHGSIEAEGQVAWEAAVQAVSPGATGGIQGGVLHGVAFTEVRPRDREALGTVLHASKDADRAASPRLPLQISATCESENPGGPPLPGVTEAIGRESLALRLPHALPLETAVRVTLHTLSEPLTLQGTVLHVEEEPGRPRPGEGRRHLVHLAPLAWHTALYLALLLTTLSEPGCRRCGTGGSSP